MKRKRDRDDDSSDSERKSKKSKHSKVKKDKKKKDKKKKEKKSKEKKKKKDVEKTKLSEEEISDRKRMVPMTKEEWEKQQSVVRRVYDEDTGRVRLVKGSGEILEECVSRERQQAINKQATLADGQSFQRDLSKQL